MKKWKFNLGASVVLVTSFQAASEEALAHDELPVPTPHGGAVALKSFANVEGGIVIGRSEQIDFPDQFRVRYKAGDGRQVSDWFTSDEIALDPRVPHAASFDDKDPMFAEVDEATARPGIARSPVREKTPAEQALMSLSETAANALYHMGMAYDGKTKSVALNIYSENGTAIQLNTNLP